MAKTKSLLWCLVLAMALAVPLCYPHNTVGAESDGPTLATVKGVCLRQTNDFHLDAYVYYEKYLFCNVSDDYTAAQDLYFANGQGRFEFIRGGGGEYRAKDLVQLANVPLPIANYLVSTMKIKMDAVQTGLQKPSR